MTNGNTGNPEPPVADAEAGQMGKCALCNTENTILKESHSIPKFVFDWMKETSKTGYLRDGDDVNYRQQDGPKEYLLCGACEGDLSKSENQLSAKCFKKIANYQKQQSAITVTEEMRVAVLSIFWRALLTVRTRSNNREPVDDLLLDEFLANAKAQIRANHCQFTIYITPFVGNPPYYGLDSTLTYNLERGSGGQDARFFDDPHRAFITLKIPFIYFYIFIGVWPSAEVAKATEFSIGHLQLDTIRDIPTPLKDYINHQQQHFESLKLQISASSRQQILDAAVKNPNITGSDKSLMRSKK